MDPNQTPSPEDLTPPTSPGVTFTPPAAWPTDPALPSPSPTPNPLSQPQSLSQEPVSPPTPEISPLPTQAVSSSSKKSGFLKTFFIILALVLFGTLVGVLASHFLPMPSAVVVPTPSPTIAVSTIPTPTLDPTVNWDTHATSKYLIKYPSDWKVFSTPLEGEALFQIKPNSISEGENYPGLFIEFKSSTSTSLGIQEGIYSKMGLSKTATVFNGQPATKYFGMLPTKNVGGKIVTGTIQQTNILFERADFIYTIGYSYDNNQVDQKQETFFSQILSTFKFTDSTTDLKSQVENWTSYTKSSSNLSWHKCPGESPISSSLKEMTAAYPAFTKEINGVKLAITSKLDFTSTDIAKFTLCQVGAYRPINVSKDYILWVQPCSTGIAPENSKCANTLSQIEKMYQK